MALSGGPPVTGRKTSGPRSYRAYAVGDVHGRLDLLEEMLALIEADVRGRRKAKTVLVFLGDLIDRGPQSAEVVERLRLYSPEFARTVFLMGNHEEVMLRVLSGEVELLDDWLKFGGAECVRSYGPDPDALKRMRPAAALEQLKSAVPKAHVDFIRSFADTLSFGNYLFVHAGIRPGVALADQAQRDMRWIRHPFLDDERDHGCLVVHGHTIGRNVDERPNRICIDTGAYRTGVLTALGIEESRRWFLQTGGVISKMDEYAAQSGLDLSVTGGRAPA
jgi:calcineurin-like phosphoesterase family protein